MGLRVQEAKEERRRERRQLDQVGGDLCMHWSPVGDRGGEGGEGAQSNSKDMCWMSVSYDW